MPSLEIICIGQKHSTKFGKLSIAIKSENKLLSHRSPSHFQKDFDKLKGCIYHIGCPHLRHTKQGTFEAFDLLSRKCIGQERTKFLQFKRKFVPDIKRIMKQLLLISAQSRIVFTSDYQFSSNKPKRIDEISLSDFWKYHDTERLRFNTLYVVVSDVPTA